MTEIQNGQRRDAILGQLSGKFDIGKERDTSKLKNLIATVVEGLLDKQGTKVVRSNAKAIESAAKKYNVPADLVRAVAYLETTHGFYDAFRSDPTSIRPMNIQYRLWSQLLNESYGKALREGETSKSLLSDPEINVDIGAKLLSKLEKYLPGFSVEAIGSLYNHLGTNVITPYGSAVKRLYDEKPWQEKPHVYNPFEGKDGTLNPKYVPDRDGAFQIDTFANRGGPTGYNSQPKSVPAAIERAFGPLLKQSGNFDPANANPYGPPSPPPKTNTGTAGTRDGGRQTSTLPTASSPVGVKAQASAVTVIADDRANANPYGPPAPSPKTNTGSVGTRDGGRVATSPNPSGAAGSKVAAPAASVNVSYQANTNRDRQEPASSPTTSVKSTPTPAPTPAKVTSTTSQANNDRDHQGASPSTSSPAKATTASTQSSTKTTTASPQANTNRDRQENASGAKTTSSPSSSKSTSSSSSSQADTNRDRQESSSSSKTTSSPSSSKSSSSTSSSQANTNRDRQESSSGSKTTSSSSSGKSSSSSSSSKSSSSSSSSKSSGSPSSGNRGWK
jgi:hypothetical protein